MPTISDHLKRIRKEAVQNDFITFAWVMYSAILIIFCGNVAENNKV